MAVVVRVVDLVVAEAAPAAAVVVGPGAVVVTVVPRQPFGAALATAAAAGDLVAVADVSARQVQQAEIMLDAKAVLVPAWEVVLPTVAMRRRLVVDCLVPAATAVRAATVARGAPVVPVAVPLCWRRPACLISIPMSV
jgi:hypothetical protein